MQREKVITKMSRVLISSKKNSYDETLLVPKDFKSYINGGFYNNICYSFLRNNNLPLENVILYL